MARQSASLPGGMHLSYDLSVGVIARIYLRSEVRAALRSCGRDGVLRWDPPAEVMMYSVNVLAHFRPVSARKVSHCLVDGLRWASRDGGLRASRRFRVRVRELRRSHLRPFRNVAWVSLPTPGRGISGPSPCRFSGPTLNAPDETENPRIFGSPGSARGAADIPQLRLTVTIEVNTRAAFA